MSLLRLSACFGLILAAACCKPVVKALPDLPPPEYEPARQLDLTPKPAASATPSAAPSAAPAPPPAAPAAPTPAPPKG